MLTSGELVWLMAGVARGDHDAFARLYPATSAKIYGVIVRILRRRDLAEEAMVETYVRVWRRAREFAPACASPMTWIVAIARNHALDAVRRNAGPVEEEPLAPDAGEIAEPVLKREMTDELKRLLACMGNLDEEARRLLLFAYYGGWTREQLAAKAEQPVSTVKAWLRRSLTQVRECLA